ncbi:unnamed protein product [Amoebophrya sp. A120]|nr:unnamed protein product [Amoebophrya sp. A120]|eukprot:GSA120T00020966001.1
MSVAAEWRKIFRARAFLRAQTLISVGAYRAGPVFVVACAGRANTYRVRPRPVCRSGRVFFSARALRARTLTRVGAEASRSALLCRLRKKRNFSAARDVGRGRGTSFGGSSPAAQKRGAKFFSRPRAARAILSCCRACARLFGASPPFALGESFSSLARGGLSCFSSLARRLTA